MPEAYIVDAVRTPVGKKKGSLAAEHPADLGAHVLKSLVARNDIDPLAVECDIRNQAGRYSLG
jgi:acetyl-CoA C-acetyltransferase